MNQKEKVKENLEESAQFHEKIQEIVKIYEKLDEIDYQILRLESIETSLTVHVEFYTGQEMSKGEIYIDFDVLENEEAFKEFEESMKKEIEERKQKEQ